MPKRKLEFEFYSDSNDDYEKHPFKDIKDVLSYNHDFYNILPLIGDTIQDDDNNDFIITSRTFEAGVLELWYKKL